MQATFEPNTYQGSRHGGEADMADAMECASEAREARADALKSGNAAGAVAAGVGMEEYARFCERRFCEIRGGVRDDVAFGVYHAACNSWTAAAVMGAMEVQADANAENFCECGGLLIKDSDPVFGDWWVCENQWDVTRLCTYQRKAVN